MSDVKVEPRNGWVLVEIIDGKTEGGIIIPDGDHGPLPGHCTVLKTSIPWFEGPVQRESRLLPGDTLMLDPDAQHVRIRDLKRGVVYNYLHERDVIAVASRSDDAPN